MENTDHRAVAIVGLGAVLPDAPNVPSFWENIKKGRYSVSEVDRDRWDPALYYDPDPNAPDKTYSKIGGWVRDFVWDPMKWHLPIPPRVVEGMDGAQKWAVACTREALEDYGYPKRPLDLNRTAVILGNAMAGEKHYQTAMRIYFPEFAHDLSAVSGFASLPERLRRDITRELHERMGKHLPLVTEDSMPGELSNCIAGRIANLFNFRGPNFTCDAACASAMAAITSAVEGLVANDFDAVITGGIDRNMGASTFVKFCKIGALSATGSRPYAEGADGFVMGEGGALFLMKRLADAERDGDRIYAVLRGMGGSSDGKGKGITAPNPVGQKLAVERGWQNAGLSPASATYFEGHGTSTRVGDVVEAQSMIDLLNSYQLPQHSIALGSVKSNFGHLKGAAGSAGLLKLTLALHHKVLPPSVNCDRPTHEVDFAHSPLYVNTDLKPWTVPNNAVRCGGLSAFGFGGTNFHAVLEEYIPHRLNGNGKRTIAVIDKSSSPGPPRMSAKGLGSSAESSFKAPLRGALVIGGNSTAALIERLKKVVEDAKAGSAPAPAAPAESELRASERIAIDYANAAELAEKGNNALKGLAANQPAIWKALRAQGVYRGHGPAAKIAFLYPGQGSQYVNMLQPLLSEPIVAETFAEADRVMQPLLGKPLSEYIFVDGTNPKAVAKSEEALKQTAVTQPAVLATDFALTKLLAAYGITPDLTMGHSLGEYGALVAAEALPFADALEAVSARGREMTRFALTDNGRMAAVFAPIAEIERILKTVEGYVVIANINSNRQAVIGGTSKAVEQAMQTFVNAGYEVAALPVSHAFHTSIVAPASEPLRKVLERLHVAPPQLPVVANTNGELYPTGDNVVPQMLDILAQQVASPVQFIKGLGTLYDAGARVFVEVGPKKALQGFAEDVLGDRGDVVSIFTNHPKVGDVPAFNQALCCLYSAGFGKGVTSEDTAPVEVGQNLHPPKDSLDRSADKGVRPSPTKALSPNGDHLVELGRMFADVLERGWQIFHPEKAALASEPVCITGAALGLPGTEHIFDDGNIARLLRGEQFIDSIPDRFRHAMLEKHITRLVKNDNGGTFETISNVADVLKLAGRGGEFDLENEFGISADRRAALDRDTQLAIAVGLDALRDAGIPLVMRYKTTTKGTQLPDRWMLPEALRDDTGIIFGSAFPGLDSFADEMNRYHQDRARRNQLALLEALRLRTSNSNGDSVLVQEIDRRIEELCDALKKMPYVFDRRYLFRVLPMGHSQFAEYIGARGPNTALNAACASTTQAVAVAEDWIRTGRCQRVIVVTADDITGDNLIDWMGAGFLATGAAATDDVVEEAALPFDRRRHGMILGMGAAGIVVESADAARERGVQPICQVLSAVTANSAYHGTRLDVQHITRVMEDLVGKAELHSGIQRDQIAPRTMFVSHETYTPARGGSAAAEIHALRCVFRDAADKIVIANSKGFTGHAMGAGIEDVLAVKALETGVVPPVANFKEVDPELGPLNLSKGGVYPVEYALRLGAGFGSQISMTLLRWVPTKDGTHRSANALGYEYRIADKKIWSTWLSQIAGRATPELEVVRRTLRIRDAGAASQTIETAPQQKAVGAAPVGEPAAPIAAETPAISVPLKAAVRTPEPPVAVATPALTTARPPMAPNQEGSEPAVRQRILALVVEKTGYPKDMLDLDLDLEADLGVDTVKQAEMFAAIREIYNIPRDENRKLRDYPTLAHVIRFVLEKRPDLATISDTKPPAEVQSVAPPEAQPLAVAKQDVKPVVAAAGLTAVAGSTVSEQTEDTVKERILALAVEKTGYPKDMLDLDLDLEADLGVDTVKQAEMFAAIREIYNIPRDENRKLRDYPTLAHVIGFVLEKRPDLATTSKPKPLAEAQSVAPAEAQPLAVAKEDVKPVLSEDGLTAVPGLSVSEPEDTVKERILALAVEKTGYPKDMLDLDLDLEADLGVDTVKQAEMFAAIRQIFDIPRDENRKLRDYPTLSRVIRFVYEQRPDLAKPVGVEKTEMAKAAPATEAPPEISKPNPEPAPAQMVAPVPAAESHTRAAIKEKVLEIAAEKTGYPKDMLDLDLDLEADLGVDTVKQAEMFAAIRAVYNIPRDQNLKLRDFPTLAHVIQFAEERAGLQESTSPEAQAVKNPAASVSGVVLDVPSPERPKLACLDAANKIPRRVPIPVLRPPLSLCKATGVKLQHGSRVVIMPDKGGVAKVLAEVLKGKGAEVLQIEGTPDAESLVQLLQTWIDRGPVHGVYWLPALDHEGQISTLVPATWREAVRVRVKSLYATMRALYDQIAKPGTFLVTATRLGGQHGYDEAGAVAPLGGAVVGFAKTYKRERIEAVVKAVDFEINSQPQQIADRLIEETLRDNGAVEIGYSKDGRWTIRVQEQSAVDGKSGFSLDSRSVFVVTGAAGSIVSAITADLAAASGGTFYLLDLVPEPDPDHPDLKRFTTDKEGLKRDLIARMQERKERATPALVEKELAAIERAQAAASAIEAVRAAGGSARYFRVDLRDAGAVANVIRQVREFSGHIDVLLHAAGIDRSHSLSEKDPREFDLVFDVKADGFFNLLHAIGDMPLGATVAFSSIAARFGNPGQTDYSSANDLLCKITSSFRTTRPSTRGIAIDWTAWSGIGMAARGSIPKVMEMAGIDMLAAEAGVPIIRRELTAGATRGEVVIGQRLGVLLEEWDEAGGLDLSAANNEGLLSSHGPMVGSIQDTGIFKPFVIETTLDPKVQPFLYDHQIEGTPVLPGVMGVEAFAEAAIFMLPGWRVEAIEDVNFLSPFKFYRHEPRTVIVEAAVHPYRDGIIADSKLIGRRTIPSQADPQITTHFTARVRLTREANKAPSLRPIGKPEGVLIRAADIYKLYFHGPAYQVIEKAWWDGKRIVGLMSGSLPANHQPSNLPTLMAPRLIELCFQTAGVWEMGIESRMGLPRHIDRVSWVSEPPLAEPLYAVVLPNPKHGFDAEVVDEHGNCYLRLEGYQTVAVPGALDAERVKPLHAAMLLEAVAA